MHAYSLALQSSLCNEQAPTLRHVHKLILNIFPFVGDLVLDLGALTLKNNTFELDSVRNQLRNIFEEFYAES